MEIELKPQEPIQLLPLDLKNKRLHNRENIKENTKENNIVYPESISEFPDLYDKDKLHSHINSLSTNMSIESYSDTSQKTPHTPKTTSKTTPKTTPKTTSKTIESPKTSPETWAKKESIYDFNPNGKLANRNKRITHLFRDLNKSDMFYNSYKSLVNGTQYLSNLKAKLDLDNPAQKTIYINLETQNWLCYYDEDHSKYSIQRWDDYLETWIYYVIDKRLKHSFEKYFDPYLLLWIERQLFYGNNTIYRKDYDDQIIRYQYSIKKSYHYENRKFKSLNFIIDDDITSEELTNYTPNVYEIINELFLHTGFIVYNYWKISSIDRLNSNNSVIKIYDIRQNYCVKYLDKYYKIDMEKLSEYFEFWIYNNKYFIQYGLNPEILKKLYRFSCSDTFILIQSYEAT